MKRFCSITIHNKTFLLHSIQHQSPAWAGIVLHHVWVVYTTASLKFTCLCEHEHLSFSILLQHLSVVVFSMRNPTDGYATSYQVAMIILISFPLPLSFSFAFPPYPGAFLNVFARCMNRASCWGWGRASTTTDCYGISASVASMRLP